MELSAQELRIGNIVRWKYGEDEYNTVHSIDPEQIDLQIITPFGVRPEDIEGVPLTEEWLLRFWFKKNINKNQIEGIEMTLRLGDKTVLSSCGKLEGGLSVLCLCGGNYFANNLHYVHQLQNLYFCLVGDELTINK